jgi:hypothetical protein
MGGLERVGVQIMLSNVLKTAAAAGLFGLAIAGASASTASAATYETRCYGDDCYRVRCNDFGGSCARMEYLGDVGYVRHRDRMVCDSDGDECHWVRERIYNYDYDDDFSD